MAWISLMTGVLNLSLNYWWIQSFGVIGAAYASVVSYMFAMTSSAIWGRRAFALPRPDREVLKIVAATAVMAAVVWAVTMPAGVWGLAVRIATGAAAYGAAIWALNLGGLRGALWTRLRPAFAPRHARRLRR
jgi:peptidoglycan biosynthesis protein MviN/MurJ (putative lipid II flippase)